MDTLFKWERHSIKWERPVNGNAITVNGNAITLIRNCQSLDWAEIIKKFESLGGQGEFLMILQSVVALGLRFKGKTGEGSVALSRPGNKAKLIPQLLTSI